MSETTTLISLREFARRVGVSDTTIRKAVKSGKIVEGLIDGKIDHDKAFREWSKAYDPAYASNDKLRSKMMAGIDKADKTADEHADEVHTGSMNTAKRAQAILKAKLLDLEFKERQGALVDKKMVYMALFESGKEVKASIMAVPDRVIDAIFSASSRNEAHTLLTQALIEALDSVNDINNNQILDK